LNGVNCFFLIRAQEAKPIPFDEAGPLGLIQPCSLGFVARSLGENDVVAIYGLFDEAG
jgi:glyoxylate carboligase